jgi:hypothetical protein
MDTGSYHIGIRKFYNESMPAPMDEVVVIVGAGISFEEPTAAAGFGDIRDKSSSARKSRRRRTGRNCPAPRTSPRSRS